MQSPQSYCVLNFFRKILLIGLLSTVFIFDCAAQGNSSKNISVTIPEVAIVAVRGASGTTVAFGLTGPTEAGRPFEGDDQYDSTLWLNYSSIRGSSKPKKHLYVKISSGSLPSGFTLRVKALAHNGNGKGSHGTPQGGWVTLSTNDQRIVKNIHTAYTGKGHNKGHNLVYNLQIADMSSVDADDQSSLQILYTIAD